MNEQGTNLHKQLEEKRAELLAVHRDLGKAHEQIQALEARIEQMKLDHAMEVQAQRGSLLAVIGADIRQTIHDVQGDGTRLALRRVLGLVDTFAEENFRLRNHLRKQFR